MKQEYIIGDWVMLNRRKAFVFESYIDTDNTFVYIINDEEYKANELKGIPLTPEILEKNKWRLQECHEKEFFDDISWNSYYNRALSDVSLRFYPEEKAFFPYLHKNSISEKPIKYVHQFQHLLFGLDIDSEIEVPNIVLNH